MFKTIDDLKGPVVEQSVIDTITNVIETHIENKDVSYWGFGALSNITFGNGKQKMLGIERHHIYFLLRQQPVNRRESWRNKHGYKGNENAYAVQSIMSSRMLWTLEYDF